MSDPNREAAAINYATRPHATRSASRSIASTRSKLAKHRSEPAVIEPLPRSDRSNGIACYVRRNDGLYYWELLFGPHSPNSWKEEKPPVTYTREQATALVHQLVDDDGRPCCHVKLTQTIIPVAVFRSGDPKPKYRNVAR